MATLELKEPKERKANVDWPVNLAAAESKAQAELKEPPAPRVKPVALVIEAKGDWLVKLDPKEKLVMEAWLVIRARLVLMVKLGWSEKMDKRVRREMWVVRD